ncbi:hypothetical protein LCGC14_2375050, partial [marine sediment metagenome]
LPSANPPPESRGGRMSQHTVKLTDRDLYLNSVGKSYPIGSMGETDDARLFRYALVGASDINANLLCQSRVSQTSWDTIVVPTATLVADTKISLTDQSNTWNKDELENGYLICETDPGNTGPNSWRIQGNDAVSGTNDFNVYFAEGATIGQVIGTSDTMHFMPSPWSKVIVSPVTTKTGLSVGITFRDATATRYVWLQTGGICGVAMDNGGADATIGEGLIADVTTAGNLNNVTASSQFQILAQTLTVQGLTSADIIPVFLTIE